MNRILALKTAQRQPCICPTCGSTTATLRLIHPTLVDTLQLILEIGPSVGFTALQEAHYATLGYALTPEALANRLKLLRRLGLVMREAKRGSRKTFYTATLRGDPS